MSAAFGTLPADVPVVRSVDVLAPKFRAAVVTLLDGMHAKGLDATIAESLRTDERQQYLYGFGREYDDGRGIVTNSPTGHTSWHFYGLAVDIISSSQGWDAPSRFWTMLGGLAQHYGLAWGGAWPTFPDRPHVQWGAPMRRSPSSEARALYASGGVEAVWHAVEAV